MSDSRRRARKSKFKQESDPRRWAHFIFIMGAGLASWVFAHAVEDIWDIVWSYYPQVGRASAFVSSAVGITLAIIGTGLAWRKEHWFRFVTEVVLEMQQIVWPTRPEIRSATVVVLVMTLICSVLLFAMDQVWSRSTNLLYGI